MTTPITIPKRTVVLNKSRSPLYKLSQGYWDLPSLTDESVQNAVAPYVPASYTEDSENVYMIPTKSPTQTDLEPNP